MHAISTKPEAAGTGLEDVYRDSVWRIARVTSPEMVLKYDPRLADLGCLDCLEEAEFFARERILWIVERHTALVATLRRSDDDKDAVFWKEPVADDVDDISQEQLAKFISRAVRIEIESSQFGDGPVDGSFVEMRLKLATLEETEAGRRRF